MPNPPPGSRPPASTSTDTGARGGAASRRNARKAARRAARRVPELGPTELAELFRIGREAGLDVVGACRAVPWVANRRILEARRADGIAGRMAFTYRNPARSTDPTRVLGGASTLIVGGLAYVQEPATTTGHPTAIGHPAGNASGRPGPQARVAAYATADHYGRLTAALGVVADGLRSLGARCVVSVDQNHLVDREAAWRAGLGWYGRNSLVLSPGWGSWIVLGSVVTDARLVDHTPRPVPFNCGTCRRCIDACPTGAIVADGVVDARRCLSWLLQQPGRFPPELRVALGDHLYGCDDCQEVCPPNRAVERREVRLGTARNDLEPGRFVDAIEMLGLDDAELAERCDRWYVPGRDVAVVRRNLIIVVGNVAHPGDDRARAVLGGFRDGPDPMLAEHANWALARLDERAAGVAPTPVAMRPGPRDNEDTVRTAP